MLFYDFVHYFMALNALLEVKPASEKKNSINSNASCNNL